MDKFRFTVTVEAETEEQAQHVMVERLGPDEWYGFDYLVSYTDATDDPPF